MVLLDLLGRRWSLRVLWELRGGPKTFRELRVLCDEVSPTVLNRRLKELRDAGLIQNGEGGYDFTSLGRELAGHLLELDAWSKRWAKD